MTPRIIPDRDRYRKFYLDEDYDVTLSNGHTLSICKGYRFNGHSVPLIFRPFFPNTINHKDLPAALVHDVLLEMQGWHRYNRKFIDEQYVYFHQIYQHSAFRTRWMTRAVTWWGYLTHTLWGDYRGEPRDKTCICVTVTVIE